MEDINTFSCYETGCPKSLELKKTKTSSSKVYVMKTDKQTGEGP